MKKSKSLICQLYYLSLLLFLCFVTTLLLSSCATQSFYIPDEPIQLQFSEAKQTKGSVSFSPRPQEKFLNLQVGYSPIKYLAVAANHFHSNNQGLDFSRTGISSKYRFNRIAVGGYFPIDIYADKNQVLLIDLYGDIGLGRYKYKNSSSFGEYSLFHRRYSLQAGFHFIKKFSAFSIIIKRGIASYYKGRLLGNLSSDEMQIFSTLTADNSFQIKETAFKYSIGISPIKFYTFIAVFKNPLTNSLNLIDSVNSYTAGIGVQLNIIELYNNISKNKKAK